MKSKQRALSGDLLATNLARTLNSRFSLVFLDTLILGALNCWTQLADRGLSGTLHSCRQGRGRFVRTAPPRHRRFFEGRALGASFQAQPASKARKGELRAHQSTGPTPGPEGCCSIVSLTRPRR